MTKVNILGTEYTIEVLLAADDTYLRDNDIDGYCDKTTKRIVVRAEDETSELGTMYTKRLVCGTK